jgi:hypothetical protein
MIKSIPMEQGRVECDPNDVESYFDELAILIDGKPAAFISHLDESGFQAWADKRVQHVIIPACYQSDEIPILVDRVAQRNSLLVYIVADGTYLRPLLIIPHKTIESVLIEQGINSELATMVHQEHGFILTVLFENWCPEVFVTALEERRQHLGIGEKQSSF